jgi:formylglycine-generating enzyme required for sulfatase activity/pimeloyl-ACP methyl ester carboxylesterase
MMKCLHVCALFLLVACIVGCGGGSKNAITASASAMTFSIMWPSRTGDLPATAASIQVALSGKDGLPAPSVINRPDGTGEASIASEFRNLPVGTLTYTITGYPQANKTGTPVGTASGTIDIVAGKPAALAVSALLNNAIGTLTISPSTSITLATGGTAQLSANAKDPFNRLVLVAPGRLAWVSADAAKAQVDTTGFVLARDAGTVAISVQDTSSTKSASATFTVNGPPVTASTTMTVNDTTGGTVSVAGVANAPSVTIPAGILSNDAKVTVSALASLPTPPVNTEAQVVGTPIAVTITGAEVDTATTLTLTTTVSTDPNKMTLLGYERNGEWTAAPVTSAGGVSSAEVPIQSVTTATKGGTRQWIVTDLLGLTIMVSALVLTIERNYTDPSMDVYSYVYASSDRTKCYWQNIGDNKWKTSANTSVALMVHGLGQSKTTFDTLAFELLDKKKYDAVYAVDYQTGYGIDAQGKKLATLINDRVTAGMIDIYAHSMGGLVSRSAIERHNAADKVGVFTSMGTPHFGVTASVFASLFLNYGKLFGIDCKGNEKFVQEMADLFTLSPFLISLNWPTHTPCVYRSLVGTDMNKPSKYDNTFSWALIPPHDGMVESYSAGFDLSGESADYVKATVSLNHSYVTMHDVALAVLVGWRNERPTLTLIASNKAVTQGQPVILSWTSTGADTVVSSNFGATTVSGTKTIFPTYADTYTLTVSGRLGYVTQSVSVGVGGSYIHPTTGATMMLVPRGTYAMGSPTGIGGADEQPACSTTLNVFYIDRTEVTVAQYRKFAQATSRAMPDFTESTYPQMFDQANQPMFDSWYDPDIDSYPMVCVSWDDAQAYADWAGLKLPTEAQWEYVARGEAIRNYPWGGTATVSDWYNGWDQNKCSNSSNSGPHLYPVGSFSSGASWCRVQDMAGSVSEWCRDKYAANYYEIKAKYSVTYEPINDVLGTMRVVRGGGIGSREDDCRTAARKAFNPTLRFNTLGFRCVASTY